MELQLTVRQHTEKINLDEVSWKDSEVGTKESIRSLDPGALIVGRETFNLSLTDSKYCPDLENDTAEIVGFEYYF